MSKVVISKETPLHDPAKVFGAAIGEALVPGRPGSAIDEIALALKLDSPEYAELYRWSHSDEAPLDTVSPRRCFSTSTPVATPSSPGPAGRRTRKRCIDSSRSLIEPRR